MNFAKLILCLGLGVTTLAHGQSRIVCTPESKGGKSITSIWPDPYLSKLGQLCFDVKGWPDYSGNNCVGNGGRISWTGLVIVTVDGKSEGRDSTSFRVNRPTVNRERLEYVIEWSRGGAWKPMQSVKINRLSGEAVSYWINEHGGDSYQCHLEQRKL
jgi:hypothetical protein